MLFLCNSTLFQNVWLCDTRDHLHLQHKKILFISFVLEFTFSSQRAILKHVLRIRANRSSQNFSQACTYIEGVIILSPSSLKWFIPVEHSLGNARASQLGSVVKEQTFELLQRCYVNNFTRGYITTNIIMHHSEKSQGRHLCFPFF